MPLVCAAYENSVCAAYENSGCAASKNCGAAAKMVVPCAELRKMTYPSFFAVTPYLRCVRCSISCTLIRLLFGLPRLEYRSTPRVAFTDEVFRNDHRCSTTMWFWMLVYCRTTYTAAWNLLFLVVARSGLVEELCGNISAVIRTQSFTKCRSASRRYVEAIQQK